ncbi:MAG: FdtA/QdtA family cupin domain-containing protein [Cyanobacteriota bacterium]
MPGLISLKTFTDDRGNLTVIEDKELPFKFKRVFYIYGVDDSVRGGHRHKITYQALICLKGHCQVHNNNGKIKEEFWLDKPYKCLILYPEDWHTIDNFSEDCILQVMASEYYDPDDYIMEGYN